MQRHHAHAMIRRIAARGAGDDHVVTHLERVSGHALSAERWAAGSNVSSIAHPINSPVELAWEDEELYSQHPGGAHVLMADGSGHFVGETAELRVVQALASRDGEETTGLDALR
jgi:prepilin-type processing-associated H-X9-DG protein